MRRRRSPPPPVAPAPGTRAPHPDPLPVFHQPRALPGTKRSCGLKSAPGACCAGPGVVTEFAADGSVLRVRRVAFERPAHDGACPGRATFLSNSHGGVPEGADHIACQEALTLG